jgi:hypothetical protein
MHNFFYIIKDFNSTDNCLLLKHISVEQAVEFGGNILAIIKIKSLGQILPVLGKIIK